MGKPKSLDDKTRARRTLVKSGASVADVDRFELAILREVASHSSISGNASAYTVSRIEELERQNEVSG